MTSDNSLSLILRRLDEIERKLDDVLQELRTLHTPAAIGGGGHDEKEGPRPEGDGGQASRGR